MPNKELDLFKVLIPAIDNNMKEFRFYVDDKIIKRKFIHKGYEISTRKANLLLAKL